MLQHSKRIPKTQFPNDVCSHKHPPFVHIHHTPHFHLSVDLANGQTYPRVDGGFKLFNRRVGHGPSKQSSPITVELGIASVEQILNVVSHQMTIEVCLDKFAGDAVNFFCGCIVADIYFIGT